MDNSKELKRIYRIEVQGIEDATKKVTQLNAEIQLQTQIKKEAQKILLANPGDVVQIEKQSKVVAESEIAIKKLNAEKRIATKEAGALITAQEKIANAEMKAVAANNLTANSYTKLFAESKRLNQLYRDTDSTSPLFGKIKQQAIEAQQKVYDFNRTLSGEGTLVGEYSKGIINAFKSADMGQILQQQVKKGEAAIKELDASLEKLKLEYQEAKTAGVGSLQAIEQKLIENRQASLQLTTQVGAMRSEMGSTGTVGNQLTSELKSGFKGLTSDITNAAIGFIGFQAAMSGVQGMIHQNYELSDSFSDLQIRLKGDKQAADEVLESLKKIETRTSIVELVNTASIVAKKGVAKEEIAGITEALDKYFVVAGKEAGNREEGVASIVKLISIFNEDKHVTKERVNEISGALVGLQNSGVATGAKMISFAERVGSIRGITGITLPNVLGLGAAMEQLGQRSEVAGTAAVQILTKMFADVPKYAKIAQVSVEDFRKTLKDNPFEALVQISEKLKGGGQDFEKAAQDFEDAGVKRAGLKTVLGDIAGNADFVRKRMNDAALAISNSGSISDAAALKQENFAAVLDKISKQFASLGNNKTIQSLFYGIANSILYVLKLITAIPFGIIITGVSAIAVAYAYYQGNLISTALAQQWNNEATLLGTLRNAAARLGLLGAAEASRVKAAALALETVATEEATIATTELNVATKASPLGLILGVLALLLPAMTAFGSSTSTAAKSMLDLNKESKLEEEVAKRAATATAEQSTKLDLLVAVLKDAKTSVDTKKDAMIELIKIDKSFDGVMTGNIVNLDKLKTAYDSVTTSIRLKANAEASASILADANKEVTQTTVLRKRIELAKIKTQQGEYGKSEYATVNLTGLSKEEQNLLGITESNFSFAQNQYDSILSKLVKKEEVQTENYKTIYTFNQKAQAELEKKLGVEKPKEEKGTSAIDKDAEKEAKKSAKEASKREKEESRKKNEEKSPEQLRDDAINRYKAEEETKKKLEEIKYKNGKESEIQYLESINSITQEYSDKKLAVVLNAAKQEQNRISEFQLDKINSTKDSEEKIYKLKLDALKKEEFIFLADPKKSKEENANAKIEVDKLNLASAKKYQQDALLLENQYHIKSVENEKKWAKDIKDINEKLHNDIVEIDKAKLDDAKNVGDTQLSEFKSYIAAKRLVAIEAGKSTTDIDKEEKIGVGARVLASLNVQLPIIKKLYEEGQISAKEYYDFLTEHDKAAAENADNLTKDLGKNFIKRAKEYKTFYDLVKGEVKNLAKNLGASDEVSNALGDGLNQAYSMATDALNNYYSNKQKQIDADKQRQLEALQVEKELVMGRAQSKAEELAIDRQYKEKQKEIERAAFEEQKKIKKAQAKIAFVTELANIWSSVWTIGNPVVAAVLGALYSGLALVRYNGTVKNLDNEKYEQGGWVTSGGVIKGNSHANGGVPFSRSEAEGDELAIINKKSALSNQVYSVTGTPKQIASAINEVGGGVRFASGAKTAKLSYGGLLGANLKAPQEVSFLNSNSDLKNYIDATNKRIDNIKVYVVSKEVEKNNTLLKKAEAINTLA